jgi:hypothetical protein
MRKLCAVTVALIGSIAALAATSGATTKVATGDTCVANGSGSAYTLTVNLGAGSPQQDGFAVGVKGGNVTKMMIGAVPGKTLTDGLPGGTQQAWIFGSPQGVPGASVTISVSTAAPAKTFTVVPWDQEHQQWFDPFACQVSTLGTQADSAFTIGRRFTYVPATHAWMFTVKVPGPGTVNVSQNGGAKQLIASHRTKVSGGTARVAVGTTTAGRAALAKSGNLKIRLSIEFSPSSGVKPTTKTMAATLAK